MIPKLSDEMMLVVKMKALGVNCEAFEGLNTVEQRMGIIRDAIEPLLDVTYTVQNGKRITMAMQYANVYGAVP